MACQCETKDGVCVQCGAAMVRKSSMEEMAQYYCDLINAMANAARENMLGPDRTTTGSAKECEPEDY